MQKFCCSRTLPIEGADLLFADYSIEVMKQRKAFSSICSNLYSNHIKFTLAYPAVLHILSPTGEHLTFSSPADVQYYINNPSDVDTEHNNPADSSPSTAGKASRLHLGVNTVLRSCHTNTEILPTRLKAQKIAELKHFFFRDIHPL